MIEFSTPHGSFYVERVREEDDPAWNFLTDREAIVFSRFYIVYSTEDDCPVAIYMSTDTGAERACKYLDPELNRIAEEEFHDPCLAESHFFGALIDRHDEIMGKLA